MIAQVSLDLLPQLLGARSAGVVRRAPGPWRAIRPSIDRVLDKSLWTVPSAEQATARSRGAASGVDADRNPNALGVETLFEAHHASRLEIAAIRDRTIAA